MNGGLYLRGLMLDGRRKSMQPMAERLGVDHQRLQQFITSSTWDFVAVRRRLADRSLRVVEPEAWLLDDTGHLKDGDGSPCVARQYTGTAGKVTNCQIAVSVHAVTDACSAPLNWRLFMPERWDDTLAADPQEAGRIAERRRRCGIGDQVRHRPKWRLVLDMIDELAAWGHMPPLVVGDAGYGDNTTFRLGLTERGIGYVMAVKAATSAYDGDAVPVTPAYCGRGRPPGPRYAGDASNLRDLVLAAGRASLRRVTWRQGTRKTAANPTAKLRSRFTAIRVRPANRDIPKAADGSVPACWLLAEWPPGEPEPTDYWLSTLPENTPIKTLVRLAKIRWRIEHDYRELKTGLGLTHFEGRSWTGWHRHVTLASAAHLFLTELRLASPKAAGAA
nr:IS701-like element ISBj6 family transposase [Actinomadura rugatobispora]BFE31739.1 IS701-like element ISBj6 family transposase [Actinomadura rugatobispora]BFE34123.1 IS701-like element ISBj6 family transposase [Actinomadura rugatobispora]BFE36057.1 IS701-like element ISBj6 family transposase [Actinomadura rugatobispora]BFE36526.1 IS701-like element ISBj6 family transposase [Actinomadura rugatobispora]